MNATELSRDSSLVEQTVHIERVERTLSFIVDDALDNEHSDDNDNSSNEQCVDVQPTSLLVTIDDDDDDGWSCLNT